MHTCETGVGIPFVASGYSDVSVRIILRGEAILRIGMYVHLGLLRDLLTVVIPRLSVSLFLQ